MLTLISWLKRLCIVTYPVIIVGDLNCNGIDWRAFTAPDDGIQDTLLDFLCSSGYNQLVEVPTRNVNILDTVLTSHPFSISYLEVIDPFSSSDHNSVIFHVDTGAKCHYDVHDDHTVHNYYDWKREDYEAFSNFLSSVDWDNFITTNLTADSIWDGFKDIFFYAADLHVPLRYHSYTSRFTAKPIRLSLIHI